MPKAVTVMHYQYDELSDKAKAKARDWWREASAGDEWWDFQFEDFEQICAALGVTIADCKHGRSKAIYFSGFWNQGDGASFAGSYAWAPDCETAIRAHAPTDEKLHAIAHKLSELVKANTGLTATITTSGHYSHEYSMSLETSYETTGTPAPDEVEKELLEAMRDLARWLYRALEAEHEWQNADAQVEENIRANEYDFLEDGTRA